MAMADKGKLTIWLETPWVSRAFPFAAYMLFILIQDMLTPLLPEAIASVWLTPVIYAIKIAAVIGVLMYFRKEYDELRMDKIDPAKLLWALGAGIIVFVLWINMDWKFATMGTPAIYDPHKLSPNWFYAFAAIRLFGASVIVPIFEEIFWRSFILRYIVNPDFLRVNIGAFTWASFLISSVLFGLEHYLWLAGIMAGLCYNALLYKTKHINYCILAHGITNFLLGIYVLFTASWRFW